MGEYQDLDSYLLMTTPELIMLTQQSDHLKILQRLLEVYKKQMTGDILVPLAEVPRYRHTALDMLPANAGHWIHAFDIYGRAKVALDTVKRITQ